VFHRRTDVERLTLDNGVPGHFLAAGTQMYGLATIRPVARRRVTSRVDIPLVQQNLIALVRPNLTNSVLAYSTVLGGSSL
jgi:hypothetical protein